MYYSGVVHLAVHIGLRLVLLAPNDTQCFLVTGNLKKIE